MASSRSIAHNAFGDNARIHQGDVIHQHVDSRDEAAHCLADLRITDPRDDKERIERLKGGLLKESYRWILNNRDFVQWRRDPNGHLLWIRGDPGKGKTMLLCGIIDELTRKSDGGPLAFFFCQETESRINSATAVLRGLIYMLVKQRESLMKHLLQRYNDARKHLFEDSNACVALSSILTAMLEDSASKGTVLVIDALDECVTDLPKLLELITELSCSAVKLVVSSRNWLEVEELEAASRHVMLRLELNSGAISSAVDAFIENRVQKLPQFRADDGNLKDAVLKLLSANANGTFLWVAIVCTAIHNPRLSKFQVVDKVKEFPQGLVPLYQRMLEYILSSPQAQLLGQILATLAIVYRTVTLQELVHLIPELQPFEEDLDEIKRMVKDCGSFLNFRRDVVYFVHQSAKDFLLSPFSGFMPAPGRQHYTLFTTALDTLNKTLKRDIYSLRSPGFLLEDVDPPKPDPLGPIEYYCVSWIQHLQDSGLGRDHAIFEKGGFLERFLRAKFLHWLEALILSHNLSEGMRAIQMLNDLVHDIGPPHIQHVVMSASRFAQYFRPVLEMAPLQLYTAGLLFCPSRTQALFFENEIPGPWLLTCCKPGTPDEWPAYLSTLVVPEVHAVMFAPDGLRVAAWSGNSDVKVWDKTSACLGTLHDKRGQPRFAAFSENGQMLATRVQGNRIRIWNVSKEKRLATLVLEDFPDSHYYNEYMAFAENNKYLVWSSTQFVRVWDLKQRSNGARKIKLCNNTKSMKISTSGRRLALKRADHFEILDPITGETVQKLATGPLLIDWITCFSGDDNKLAFVTHNDWQVWDIDRGVCIRCYSIEGMPTRTAALSRDGTLFAWQRGDAFHNKVAIGDLHGPRTRVLPLEFVSHLAFSRNGKQLATASHGYECTVDVWEITGDLYQDVADEAGATISPTVGVRLSTDGKRVSTWGRNSRVWDAATGRCLHTSRLLWPWSLAHATLSSDYRHMAITRGAEIDVWNIPAETQPFSYRKKMTYLFKKLTTRTDDWAFLDIAFSDDGEKIVSVASDGEIRVCHARTGQIIQKLLDTQPGRFLEAVGFLKAGREIHLLRGKNVQIWDIASGERRVERIDAEIARRPMGLAYSADSQFMAVYDCPEGPETYIHVINRQDGSLASTLRPPVGLGRLAFDSSSNDRIRTDVGVFSLDNAGVGYHLGNDARWIMKDSERMVWLPSDYLGGSMAVSGNTFAVSCPRGGFIVAQFTS